MIHALAHPAVGVVMDALTSANNVRDEAMAKLFEAAAVASQEARQQQVEFFGNVLQAGNGGMKTHPLELLAGPAGA